MAVKLTIIGFGEAGSTFAGAAGWSGEARAFDILPERADAMRDCGVTPYKSAATAIAGSPLVLSLVTADQAQAVAEGAAASLAKGALYCDLNSVAPQTKQAAAAAVEAAGAHYVDVAVMAPVNPKRMEVPLLISGAKAQAAYDALTALGFTNARVVGDDVGRASTVKMLRSVMYKGVEALTAECLLACERAGVTDEVIASFAGNDWATGADYRFDRMLVHGLRRAAELSEVCKTLEGLGLPPALSTGTVQWQERLGALGIKNPPEGLAAKLAAVREAEGG